MEKYSPGAILCLIGGAIQLQLVIFSSIIFLIFKVVVNPATQQKVFDSIPKGTTIDLMSFVVWTILGAWLLITSIIILASGFKIASEDSQKVRDWSILAIIFGVLNPLFNLPAIIGGISGIIEASKEINPS